MRRVYHIGICLTLLSGSLAGQTSIFNNLLPEQIASGFEFSEGPAWHVDGFLVFSDIQANTIYKWSEVEGVQVFTNLSGNSNGIIASSFNEFIVCRHGNRDVSRMDLSGNISSLVSTYEGKQLNSPNDVSESYLGSLYFTDPPYGIKADQEELGFYGVYCLPYNASELVLLDDQLAKPNGIVFSPDGQVLYVCDTYTNRIIAYKLKNESQVRDRWVFAELSGEGEVDGITTDLYGNVYVAFGNGGIEIFSPGGLKVGHIDVPEKTRNLCFGGKYRNILFITAGTSLYRVKIPFSGDFIAPGILGVPTDQSVLFNALSDLDLDAFLEYGEKPDSYTSQTETTSFESGKPIEILIDGLKENTRYYYCLRYKSPSMSGFAIGTKGFFHTQRAPGSSFSFAVEADPHLDESSNYTTFRNMLRNAGDAAPDFLIDLGDNFMTDKLPVISYNYIEQRHLLYRWFWDEFCHSMPLFLVIGNHEGEYGWAMNSSPDNMPNMATTLRKLYYPNPQPGDFYSGSTEDNPFVGLRENYFAWTWGDALFMVIDPYINSENKPGKTGNGWNFTLGKEQYDWFRQTLENSSSKFKFVFAHQIVGGDSEGRGGAEWVDYYEMGGNNPDGSWGFDAERPGWGKPIHQVMHENGVNIYFHGHDHFYARQEKDGVIYQLVPQPAHTNYTRAGNAEDYGYLSGEILPNSGHLLVTVNEQSARVDYVSAYHEDDPVKNQFNGTIRHSYTVYGEGFTHAGPKSIEKGQDAFQIWQKSIGEVWITSDRNTVYTVRIYSISGMLIYERELDAVREESFQLPIHLLPGMYVMNIRTEELSGTFKVLL